MKVVQINKKIIKGLKIRTKNSLELNSETGKIGPLWNKFMSVIAPKLTPQSEVYGVYCNYESDMNGEFDVLAGTNDLNIELDAIYENITVKEGNYLVFSNQGQMPEAVIQAWTDVWNYFADASCIHSRMYQTDFEFYKNSNEVEVYIGIK